VNKELEEKLKTLPRSAGVYFHKSATGEIIYVGKAAVLKNRVRQYFQKSRDMDVKTQALVAEIYDTDWIETESELDALFLESEMVKRYMPRYNVLLRDDKSQMFVRIDMKSEWPTVGFTRNPADDGAEYFGPYYNGFAIKKALRYLRRVFPYYTKPVKGKAKTDLDTHIGLNPSPDMTSADYKKVLRRLIRYIKGGRKEIIKDIETHMQRAAADQDFEMAARFRNQLSDLRALQQRIMFGDKEFLDISKDRALSDLAFLLGLEKTPSRIEGYDISHISGTDVVASMVVFTNGVSDRAEYRKFKMRQQKNDDYANMYEVIARRFSEKNIKSWGMPQVVLIDGGKGQLEAAIRAMKEREVRGVAVVSVAKRNEEILVHREHSGARLKTLQSYIDGTIQDRGVAVRADGEYIQVNLHLGSTHTSGHARNLRGSNVAPARYSDVTKLIQRIRDESHRFAISYHSVLRGTRQTASALDIIPGIGPATRKKLLRTFGSMRGVNEASLEEITAAIGAAKAILVYQERTSK